MTEQQIIETLATKVMGWEKAVATDGKEYWDNGKFCGGIWLRDWNPLQNIADAWQVVEKLLEGYLHFDLSTDEDGWWATFKMVDKTFIDTKEWEASGDTPQEAICTAAMELVA